jgi:hypothetical protein
LDNRARAQQLSQLIKWEDEGAIIVERWMENCLNARDGSEPSRRALGKFLKESWSKELKRQNGVKQNIAPFTASKWQPPGPGVLPENISLCSCGPIGFALVAISQWHKELRNSLRFLSEMEATIIFPSLEGTRDNTGALVASKVTNPSSQYGDVSGPARDLAAQRVATEGSRPGPQQRAKQRNAAGPPAAKRQEGRPPAQDSYYGPRATKAETTAVGCEGCGRKGHPASMCKSFRHPN